LFQVAFFFLSFCNPLDNILGPDALDAMFKSVLVITGPAAIALDAAHIIFATVSQRS
jgi:hypothetical protein